MTRQDFRGIVELGDNMTTTVEEAVAEKLVKARGKIEEEVRHIQHVARLYKMGWRTTQFIVYFKASPGTVSSWLKEAERLGLIPKRKAGRPKVKKAHK